MKTGNTAECLADFSRLTKFRSPRFSDRYKLCEFLGVGYSSVERWFTGGNKPQSERLLGLRVFLELFGYKITETEKWPSVVTNFNKLVAFKVLPIEDAGRIVDRDKPALIRILVSEGSTSPDRIQRMKEAFIVHKESLSIKEAEWRVKLGQIQDVTPTVSKEKKPSEEVAIGSVQSDHSKPIVETLAHLIKSAIPLAEYMLSDKCSQEDREFLRQLTATPRSHGVFILSNHLHRLCSERARREIKPTRSDE